MSYGFDGKFRTNKLQSLAPPPFLVVIIHQHCRAELFLFRIVLSCSHQHCRKELFLVVINIAVFCDRESHFDTISWFSGCWISIRIIKANPLCASLTEKHSLSATNYGSIPRFYVKTLEDFAIPVSLQEAMIDSNPPKQIFQMKGSDHSPFLSKPQALHKILVEISKIPLKWTLDDNFSRQCLPYAHIFQKIMSIHVAIYLPKGLIFLKS